jgi:O-antigen/teichoic acid export membrane protein
MNEKEKKQLGKSVIWNTLGNIVYYASQYVLLILVVRLSGNYASGLLSTAMSIAAICISFSNYGMRSFQISDFAHRYNDKTYLQSRRLTVGAAGLGCCIFAFAISYTAEQRWVILLYTAARLSEGYIDVWHGYLQKKDRMDLVGLLFGLRGLLTIGGFWLGLWLTNSLVITMAILAVLSWICVFAADVPPSRRAADFAAPAAGTVWMLLWECAPLAVYSFLNSSIGSVVKLYCERISGTEIFGCFNNVFAPVQIIQVGAMYIFAPFMMMFARAWEKKQKTEYLRAFAIACGAMPVLWICGALGAWLVGPPALEILYAGKGIGQYTFLLQPAVVAAVTNIFVSILCYLLSMMREMKGLIAGNVAGILAAFLLSAPMIETMGVAGAAWATVASRAVQAVCCLAVVLWRCRRHFAPEPPQKA